MTAPPDGSVGAVRGIGGGNSLDAGVFGIVERVFSGTVEGMLFGIVLRLLFGIVLSVLFPGAIGRSVGDIGIVEVPFPLGVPGIVVLEFELSGIVELVPRFVGVFGIVLFVRGEMNSLSLRSTGTKSSFGSGAVRSGVAGLNVGVTSDELFPFSWTGSGE